MHPRVQELSIMSSNVLRTLNNKRRTLGVAVCMLLPTNC